MKILVKTENFDRRLDKSGRITGQVPKTLLEPEKRTGHVWCPKPDSPVCQTGYSGFDRIDYKDI
jgi:hypothetical protein